jgi:molybdopterin-biosynthesis enzyme MoeA-like protein
MRGRFLRWHRAAVKWMEKFWEQMEAAAASAAAQGAEIPAQAEAPEHH